MKRTNTIQGDRGIEELLRILDGNPAFRGANLDKLRLILEKSELHVPTKWPRRFDVSRIREYAAASPAPARTAATGASRALRWAIVPVAAALLFFLVWPWMTTDKGRAGIVMRAAGETMLARASGEGRVGAGDALSAGDVIVTGPGSSLDISFNESIRMRVLEGSRVELRRAVTAPRRDFDALVTAGGCIMQVSRLSQGESVSLSTPTAAASVKGTAFGVRIARDGTVRYEVFQGAVQVRRTLPPDSGLDPAASEELTRYFNAHPLLLERGAACRIRPDTVPLAAAKPAASRGLIPGLSLPSPVTGPGALSMKEEAAVVTGIAIVPREDGQAEADLASGESTGSTPGEGEQAPPFNRKQIYLMYAPDADALLVFDESSITASRAGERLWQTDLDDPIAAMPVRDGSSLYYSTVRGTVSRLDLASGAVLWTALAGGPARIAIDGTGVYFATFRGLVGRLDRRGGIMWKSSVGEDVPAAPVLSRHMVLVPTAKGRLAGIDKYRGLAAFSARFSGGISSLGVNQDRVFVATDDGQVTAYAIKEGRAAWRYSISDSFAVDMIVRSDSIYLFGRGGKVHRIGMEGDQVWVRDTGNPIVKRVAEDSESLYVPSERTLCIIKKSSGDTSWSLMDPGIVSGNVAVTEGTIFFQNEKNRLTGLKK